jgi:peptidoglycan/LPS O-acetylase OafA/YrhL
LANILNTKILIRIGVVSYGMYLLHMLAVNSVRVVLPRLGIDSQGLTFLLALLLAYIAAEISFRLFETPILNLKKRLGASRPE